jgi:curved DNA-binding protein
MEFKDYYRTLGLQKEASADDIKKAFRKLARKYHPDVSKEPEAALRMQEVNEANDVLSDPQKRAAYDKLGKQFKADRPFRPPPDWDEGYDFSGKGFARTEGFSDFFGELFKRAGRERKSDATHVAGEDRHARMFIDLLDAYQGATRSITLRSSHEEAPGEVTTTERTLKVDIPKGARKGQHLRLAGKGYPGKGDGKRGDLYLEIFFKKDPLYRVDGVDVYKTLQVAPWEAALGAKVETSTPSGPVSVSIPASSQSGNKLRLKGRGIPGDPAGDLYLVLEVVLPAGQGEKARRIYEDMARDLAFDPRAGAGA